MIMFLIFFFNGYVIAAYRYGLGGGGLRKHFIHKNLFKRVIFPQGNGNSDTTKRKHVKQPPFETCVKRKFNDPSWVQIEKDRAADETDFEQNACLTQHLKISFIWILVLQYNSIQDSTLYLADLILCKWNYHYCSIFWWYKLE